MNYNPGASFSKIHNEKDGQRSLLKLRGEHNSVHNKGGTAMRIVPVVTKFLRQGRFFDCNKLLFTRQYRVKSGSDSTPKGGIKNNDK
jgi:hypothetical protein